MKRFVLFSLMQLFAFSMFAQTLESPLELPMGEVTVEGESTYFKYTAPEDKNTFLQITTSGWSVSVTVSKDGTDETMIDGGSYNGSTLYPISKGETVIVWASTWGDGGTFNTAEIENTSVGSGLTCDDAVQGTQEIFYIPAPFDYTTYVSYPGYATFTVPEGDEKGLLEMTFYGYPQSITLSEGCDDENPITVEITEGDDYKNIASTMVEPGKTYIIKTESYAALIASFRFFVPEAGYSCAMPLEGKVGENKLPAAAGRYWYEVTTEKAGAMVVTSAANLTNGYTRIYSACDDYQPTETVGYLHGRRVFAEAGTYYVYVEKATATDTEETFTISLEDAKPYDAVATAELLTDGDYTTPLYNGVYFYTIQTPEAEGAYFIDVTPENEEFSNYQTLMRIYPESTMSYYKGGQEGTKIHLVAEANTKYILEWHCEESMNNIPFSVKISPIEKGQVYSDPIQAVVGENQLKPSAELYYSYTATQTGWLLIDTDPTLEVSFPQGASQYDGEHSSTKVGSITKIEVEKDAQYVIKFTNVTEATTFDLSEAEYQLGESATNPFIIDESGVANIPEAAGKTYYKYIAPKDGKLELNINISKDSNGKISTSANIFINGKQEWPNMNDDATAFVGTYNVSKGDEIIVMVQLPAVQTGKTVTLNVRDLLPGESSTMAIALEHQNADFEYTFPKVSNRNNAMWYSIQLNEGEFNIKSDDYFSMELYKADDPATRLTYSSTDWETYTYYLTYNVTEAGKYLVLLTYNYGELTANISGTALKAPTAIASIDELSNSKAYTIVNKRTAWGVNDTQMKTIYDLSLAADASDVNQQFAFVTADEGKTHYLYSVGKNKFVGKGGTLSDTPADAINFKKGNADSTFVLFFDNSNYLNAGGSSNTCIDGWNTADDGNSNYLTPVANFDATAAIEKINAIVPVVFEWNANKSYTITPKDATRGVLYAPEGTEALDACGGTRNNASHPDVAIDATSPAQQFAFVQWNDKYYLYSVSEKKFISKSGNFTTFTDKPGDYVTVEHTSENYFAIKFNGADCINVSTGYTYGIVTNWNSIDDGNQFIIAEAADFDPTEALAAANKADATTVEVNPAPGHYDVLPDSIVLTFSANIEALEFGVLRTETTGMRGYMLTEEDYTIADTVLTLTLPEELLAYNAQAMLQLQVKDVNGNYVTYGEAEDYITLEYTAPVVANILSCVAITPEAGSEVNELSTFTLTFANPKSSFDFVGGVDKTKAIVLKNADGEVVANGTASVDTEAYSMDVVVTLDKAVTDAGTYTLVVPEATVFNASFDPEAADLGIEMGAIYNPEFTATFTVDGSLTGIEAIIGNATSVKVYDLKGRLVGNSVKGLKKGVYVINGKKVMVK